MKKISFSILLLVAIGLIADRVPNPNPTSGTKSKKSAQGDQKDHLGFAPIISSFEQDSQTYDQLPSIYKSIGSDLVQGIHNALGNSDDLHSELNSLAAALKVLLGNTINLILENSDFDKKGKQELKRHLNTIKSIIAHKGLLEEYQDDKLDKNSKEYQKAKAIEKKAEELQKFIMTLSVAVKHELSKSPQILFDAMQTAQKHKNTAKNQGAKLLGYLVDEALSGLDKQKAKQVKSGSDKKSSLTNKPKKSESKKDTGKKA